MTGQVTSGCRRTTPLASSLWSQIESSFSIALICATSRRIPASASTNQGPDKDDLSRCRKWLEDKVSPYDSKFFKQEEEQRLRREKKMVLISPVQIFGRARTYPGRAAGRDLLITVDRWSH